MRLSSTQPSYYKYVYVYYIVTVTIRVDNKSCYCRNGPISPTLFAIGLLHVNFITDSSCTSIVTSRTSIILIYYHFNLEKKTKITLINDKCDFFFFTLRVAQTRNTIFFLIHYRFYNPNPQYNFFSNTLQVLQPVIQIAGCTTCNVFKKICIVDFITCCCGVVVVIILLHLKVLSSFCNPQRKKKNKSQLSSMKAIFVFFQG